MRSDISRFLMFAFMALFLTACKSVTVDNPVNGEVFTFFLSTCDAAEE